MAKITAKDFDLIILMRMQGKTDENLANLLSASKGVPVARSTVHRARDSEAYKQRVRQIINLIETAINL